MLWVKKQERFVVKLWAGNCNSWRPRNLQLMSTEQKSDRLERDTHKVELSVRRMLDTHDVPEKAKSILAIAFKL